METAPETQTSLTCGGRRPVAAVWHTVALLVLLGGLIVAGFFRAQVMRAEPNAHRIAFYASTMTLEWILLGFVAWGVRRHGGTVRGLIGGKWNSAKAFFIDVGVAIAFWIVALIVLTATAKALHANTMSKDIMFLVPRTAAETIVWIAVALTAGFCEEAIFRGYLQKQFIAWTGSAVTGVILSAAVFGAGHAYQSAKAAGVIFVFGALFGILAEMRKSLRPGMIAHAWQDALSGIAVRFLPK